MSRLLVLVVLALVAAASANCPNEVLWEGGSATAPYAAHPVVGSSFSEPVGITFDMNNNTFINDWGGGCTYKYAGLAHNVDVNSFLLKDCSAVINQRGGLAFTAYQASIQRQRLWLLGGLGDLYELDPATLAIVGHAPSPNVYSGEFATYDLKIDPVVGDLYFATSVNKVFRVTGWQNGFAGVTFNLWLTVATSLGTGFDGISFAKSGNMYCRLASNIVKIPWSTGVVNTNTPSLVATNIGGADGIALAGDESYLLVNDNYGTVYKVILDGTGSGPVTQIFSGGSRGDTATVGPDGCFYITQSHSVVKISTEPDCTCSLASLASKSCPTQLNQGYSTVPPFAASNFVTDMPNSGAGGVGPIGEAFDAAGNFYVVDYQSNCLIQYLSAGPTSPKGGSFNAPTGWKVCQDTRSYSWAGLAVAGGNLYGTSSQGSLYWIDINTGNVLNNGAALLNVGTAGTYDLISDPQGNLVTAGGVYLIRITGAPLHPVSSIIATAPQGAGAFDGIYYTSNGDLYARIGSSIYKLPSGSTTWYFLASSNHGFDGVAVAQDSSYLLVNNNDGTVSKYTLNGNNPATLDGTIFSGGSRGDLAKVGPDGCFYITQTDRVVKITTQDDCTCNLAAPVFGPCSGNCTVLTVSNTCESSTVHSTKNCLSLKFSDSVSTCQ